MNPNFLTMTTMIEDSELDTELQELYIIGKHWISDLEFFEQDLQVIKKLFSKSFSYNEKHRESIPQTIESITDIQNQSREIKKQVLVYLHRLKSLLDKTNASYELSIIEEHALLECGMAVLLKSFKSVKNTAFRMTAKEIRTGKNH